MEKSEQDVKKFIDNVTLVKKELHSLIDSLLGKYDSHIVLSALNTINLILSAQHLKNSEEALQWFLKLQEETLRETMKAVHEGESD